MMTHTSCNASLFTWFVFGGQMKKLEKAVNAARLSPYFLPITSSVENLLSYLRRAHLDNYATRAFTVGFNALTILYIYHTNPILDTPNIVHNCSLHYCPDRERRISL